MDFNSLPVIDLESESIINELRDACINFGFFYVKTNKDSFQSCLTASKLFFNQSLEQKIECKCNTYNLGYTSFQDETLSPLQTSGDTKEGYYIMKELNENEKLSFNLNYENIWPSYQSLSIDWKSVMLQYHEEATELGVRLIRLIALSLGLSEDYFDSIIITKSTRLRLIKYGITPSDPNNGLYGAGEHSDYGLLTILGTNEVPGLEIYIGGQWLPIPPREDCYIINLGDALSILTNNFYCSTLHRVIISGQNSDRYSAALFFGPDSTARIHPRQEFIHDNVINTTVDMTYGEYLGYKYSITHTDYKKA